MHETETYHHPDTGEAISFSLPSEEAPAMARPEDKKAAAFAFEESEPPPATRQNQDTFDELDRSIAQSMAPEKPLPKAMERSFEPLENNLKIPRKMNDTNATFEKLLSKMQSLETKVAQLTNGHTSAPTEEYVREQSVEQAHTHGEWKAENIETAEAQSHQPPSGAEVPSEGDAFTPDEPSQAMDTTNSEKTSDRGSEKSAWEEENEELLESISEAMTYNDPLMSEIMSLKSKMDTALGQTPGVNQGFVRQMDLSPDEILEIESKLDDIDTKYRDKEDMNQEEFKAFIEWQKAIPALQDEFRTCGIEFEFTQLTMKNNGESLDLHVELLESEEDHRINGLPIILETDAGNVLEMVMPPFVIDTNKAIGQSWEKAKKRSMYLADQFERRLKSLAQAGVRNNRNLDWLVTAIEQFFGTAFNKPGMGSSAKYRTYRKYKLTDFTKFLSSSTASQNTASSAQINLNVTIAELADALLNNQQPAADSSQAQHDRYVAVKQYLSNYYTQLHNNQQLNAVPPDGKIAIIAFYLSQVPMMSLGICMNEARKRWAQANNKHIRESRKAFEQYKPPENANAELLIYMSYIKDFTELWIKAGLNDMMILDNGIKIAVAALNTGALQTFFKTGNGKFEANKLERFTAGMSGFYGTPEHFETRYEQLIDQIVGNIVALAAQNDITTPAKLDFPNNGNITFTDYAAGHPFMARPDTHVPLTRMGSVLIEVRRMNRNLFTNTHLRSFYMPAYRVTGELPGNGTPNFSNGSLMLLGKRNEQGETTYSRLKGFITRNQYITNKNAAWNTLISLLNYDRLYNSIFDNFIRKIMNKIETPDNEMNPKTRKSSATLKNAILEDLFEKMLYPRLEWIVRKDFEDYVNRPQNNDNRAFAAQLLPKTKIYQERHSGMTPRHGGGYIYSYDSEDVLFFKEFGIIEELKEKYKEYFK